MTTQLDLFAAPVDALPEPPVEPVETTSSPFTYFRPLFRRYSLSQMVARKYPYSFAPIALMAEMFLRDLGDLEVNPKGLQPLFDLLEYDVMAVRTAGGFLVIDVIAQEAKLTISVDIQVSMEDQCCHYNGWVRWPDWACAGHDLGVGNYWYSSLESCLMDNIAAIERFLPFYRLWWNENRKLPMMLCRGKTYDR